MIALQELIEKKKKKKKYMERVRWNIKQFWLVQAHDSKVYI